MANDWNDLREQLGDSNMERDVAIARGDAALALARALAERAERAEAALSEVKGVIHAIPWRSLVSVYAHPGVVLDADADAIGEFLDQYADAWAGGFELRLIEEKQAEREADDYARALLAGTAPSDNEAQP